MGKFLSFAAGAVASFLITGFFEGVHNLPSRKSATPVEQAND